jgi:hypothetical protein
MLTAPPAISHFNFAVLARRTPVLDDLADDPRKDDRCVEPGQNGCSRPGGAGERLQFARRVDPNDPIRECARVAVGDVSDEQRRQEQVEPKRPAPAPGR